ncbi:hypothetical protein [uncultured Aquimarina sp.]|uniref:hypothetical protein n=1 Tax=uncultured Aquimarina sp. TaxID=575652 RepID=UPI0026118EBD|nr:hypothetical protein [uncultured Aquimarina sp.]
MLKNILNLNGVKELNKKDQKSLLGGVGSGFCYMSGPTTCCCFFEDRGDFICAPGERVRPGFGCVYG